MTKFNLSCVPQAREAEKISLTADESSMVIHTGSEDALDHRLLYTSTCYVEIQPHRWSNPTARLMHGYCYTPWRWLVVCPALCGV